MKVAFLTFGDECTPSTRYRVFQYLEGLREAGWESAVITPRKEEGAWRSSLRAIRVARKADVVFLQKRLFPGGCVRLLSAAAKGRLIYDFDDALFTPPHGKQERLSHRRKRARLQRTLRQARIVIAGNRFLAEYAGRFNPWVEILPTPVALPRHPRRPPHSQRSPQVIGWVGTSGNQHYLRSLCEVLHEVSENRLLVLRVVSDRAFEHPSLRQIENIKWEPEREALLLHEFDIGIMPLEDDEWCKGKCAFKALQYMAVGIPVVCTPVGANTEVMQDGVEGFFASSPQEWAEKMCLLLEDVQLRERMGRAGRETVSRRFSVEVTLPRLLEILRRGLPPGDNGGRESPGGSL